MSEPEPLAQPNQGNALLPLPQRQQRWTPRFILLGALIVLLGLAATIFGALGRPIGGTGSGPYIALLAEILSANQAALAMNGALIGACVAGLWLVRSTLLRAGFLLRAVVAAGVILLSPALLVFEFRSFPVVANFLFSSPFMPLFELTLGVLTMLSQISFSYGMARWQRSDKIFIWLQLLVTLGIGALIVKDYFLRPPGLGSAYMIWIITGPFLALAGIVCLLLRPACWKASPLIVLCLTTGAAASLLFAAFFIRLFTPPDAILHFQQALAVVSSIGTTLFLFGLLLLIQRVRAAADTTQQVT
jgi:hypothetical protein